MWWWRLISPIINLQLFMLQFVLNGAAEKNKNKVKSCRHGLLHNWAPENSVVQSVSSRIVLKSLVCFPQPLAAFWLLPPRVHHPLLQPPAFTDWRMTEKNQFRNHYLREQHKLFVFFSLHYNQSQSNKKKSEWFNSFRERCLRSWKLMAPRALWTCSRRASRSSWILSAEQVKVLRRTRYHHTCFFCLVLIKLLTELRPQPRWMQLLYLNKHMYKWEFKMCFVDLVQSGKEVAMLQYAEWLKSSRRSSTAETA